MSLNFTRVYTSGALEGGQIAYIRPTIAVDIDTLFLAAADLACWDEIDSLSREQIEDNLRDAVEGGCLTEAARMRWHDHNDQAASERLMAKVCELFPEAAPTSRRKP